MTDLQSICKSKRDINVILMIIKQFNGQNYQFPEGTTDEQIDKYFSRKLDPNKRGVSC